MLLIYKLFFHFLWLFDHLFGSKHFNFYKLRKNIYSKKLYPSFNEPNVFSSIEVVELNVLTKEIENSLPKDRPIILRGLLNNTTALKNWNWQHLEESFQNSEQPYTDTFSQDNFHSGTKSAKELFQNILSDNPRYSIMFSNLLQGSMQLFKELETEKWIKLNGFKTSFNKSWQFFAAGKNRDTNLHAELGTTISCQIIGEKHWVLFSPIYSYRLNPKVNWKMYIESENYSQFKNFKNLPLGIKGYEATLKAGDVLYFPACYWHFVTNKTAAVSVSFKWTDLRNFFQVPFLSLLLVTSRNPFVFFRLPLLKKLSRTFPPKG